MPWCGQAMPGLVSNAESLHCPQIDDWGDGEKYQYVVLAMRERNWRNALLVHVCLDCQIGVIIQRFQIECVPLFAICENYKEE